MVSLLCLFWWPALPRPPRRSAPARNGEAVRPLDQILPQIRNSRPGTFYDAEGPFRGPDGRMHYRLKWMTPQGRIQWLDTDARSGRVLGEEAGPRRPVWDRGQQRQDNRRYAPRKDADDNRRGRQNFGDRRNWQDNQGWNRGGDRQQRRTYDRGGARRDRDDGRDRDRGHRRGRNW